MDTNKSEQADKNQGELKIISVIISVGLLGIVAYSLQTENFVRGTSVASSGVMFGGAALLIGALIGFVFGIPRTLQQDQPVSDQKDVNAENKSNAKETKARYLANTNLEQISDWLTKILVGVGLTQLTTFPSKLMQLSEYMAKGLGNFESSQTFALSILIFFLVCGFLYGYLWARLFLARLLRAADAGAVGELETKMKQVEIDATALNLIYRQLDRSSDAPEVSMKDLTETIKTASQLVRAQIFYKAQAIRTNNWRENRTKPIMERTIPIFRALIDSDVDEQFHQNHAQLGYALKDQRIPAWAEAERELSKAIAIRGKWEDNGWILYEYNRAICRIMLDDSFGKGKPATTAVREPILKDLKAAYHLRYASEFFEQPPIDKWIELNQINKQELNAD